MPKAFSVLLLRLLLSGTAGMLLQPATIHDNKKTSLLRTPGRGFVDHTFL
jgi:hypothetical protein